MLAARDGPPSELFRWTDELKQLIRPRYVRADNRKAVPTNAWWGNLLAWDGRKESDAVFCSPYTYKVVEGQSGSIGCGFSVSYLHQYRVDGPVNDNGAIKYYFYPPTIKNLLFSAQEFKPSSDANGAYSPLAIDSWDDLGVTLTLTPITPVARGLMRTYLSLGNAFTTVQYTSLHLRLCSDHVWLSINGQPCRDGQQYEDQSFEVTLNNGQKWILFCFPNGAAPGQKTTLCIEGNALVSTAPFTGFVQAAYVSSTADGSINNDSQALTLYRQSAGTFPTAASVVWDPPKRMFAFNWQLQQEQQSSTFLHFVLQHLQEMIDLSTVTPKPELQMYAHTRGKMYAYAQPTANPAHQWAFHVPQEEDTLVSKCLHWYPPNGDISAQEVAALDLCKVLTDEIHGDWQSAMPHEGSYYFKGKALQKFGTMCLLAKKLAESTSPEMRPVADLGIHKFRLLMESFVLNQSAFPLVYDTVYKGIITSEVIAKKDMNVDFGNGVYNDHHYHYGYIINAAAMLLYLDPTWRSTPYAVKLRVFVETLIRDVINPSPDDLGFPRFRNFDWFLGHSYSHGVTPMADGKDEESTSEEVNFFYGVVMYCQVIENRDMGALAKLMLSINTMAIKTYFLLTDANTIHPSTFRKNKVTGVFFDNKCDYATWFSPNKECIHGIQMLPVSPIQQAVRTETFVKEEWDQVLSKLPIVHDWKHNGSGWTSLLFSNYSAVDPKLAVEVLAQCPMDDGLSRAWALYMAATRTV